MTSNIASDVIQNLADNYDLLEEKVTEQLRLKMRPEFLNRIDDIIIFKPLNLEQVKSIVDIMIHDLSERLKESAIQLEITENARDLLAGKGYDKSFGARPLARTIQKFIETPLSLKIIDSEITKGKVLIDAKDKEFVFKKKK